MFNNITTFIRRLIKEGFGSAYLFQFTTIFYSFFLIFIFNYFNLTYAYGQYILLIASLDFLTSFIGFNSGESIIYFLAKKTYTVNSILKIGRITDLILGSLIVIFSLITFKYIASSYLDISFSLVIVFSFKTLFFLLRNSVNGFWQYNNLFSKFYAVMIIELITKIILIMLSSFLLLNFDLESIIFIEVFSTLIFTIIIYILFLYDYKKDSSNSLTNKKKINYVSFFVYSSKLFVTSTLKSGNKKIDYLILGLFVSPLEIGVYDKLKKIFLPINALIQPFRQIYYPKYIKKINSKLFNEADSFIKKWSFKLTIIVIVYLLFVVFSKQLLFDLLLIENSYNNRFLFYCLPFSSLFLSIFWWVTSFSSSVNPNFSLTANLISTFCIIISSLILLNTLGFIGIGLALIFNLVIVGFYWVKKYKSHVFH